MISQLSPALALKMTFGAEVSFGFGFGFGVSFFSHVVSSSFF